MAEEQLEIFDKSQKLGPLSLQALGTRSRVTHDTPKITPNFSVASQNEPTGSWLTLELQRKNLLRLPTSRLTQLALDLSPQVNKGLWDFLRFSNPGYILEIENRNSRRIIEDFIGSIGSIYGSFDAFVDRIFASIFIGGAIFLELVLDNAGRNGLNIAVIDPILAKFVRKETRELGQYWQLVQQARVGNSNIPLDKNPRVRYIPIDTLPDKPYGRPIITPSVYASIFLLGLIQDLRRVIANQGLTRLDYSVSSEQILKLLAEAGDDIAGDDAKTASFISSHISDIQEAIGRLDIDSNYVHLDTVEVNYAQSGATIAMTGVDTLVRTIERQITNGLKTIPILMASNEAVAETHANRQLDFYLASVNSMQDEVTRLLEYFFGIVLQVNGRSDDVTFTFKRLRTVDKKTQAETEKIQIDNIVVKREAELISQEDAVMEASLIRDPLQIL